MDVRTLMQQAVINHAERECVVHGDRRLTFAEAWRRGTQLANALLDLGLKPGDRVGVLEDNSIEAADFFHGAAIANAGNAQTDTEYGTGLRIRKTTASATRK